MPPRRILSSYSSSAPPPEPASVESDFVVILAALLCALICAVGLVAVARCAWLRRGSPSSAAPNKGLKKKTLNSLPKTTYDAATHSDISTDCAICLAEYAPGEQIRVLPTCRHAFHVTCIDTWLGSHSSCPSCRQILVSSRCRKCGEVPSGRREVSGGGGGGGQGLSGANFLPF